jgi:hypothetical protein
LVTIVEGRIMAGFLQPTLGGVAKAISAACRTAVRPVPSAAVAAVESAEEMAAIPREHIVAFAMATHHRAGAECCSALRQMNADVMQHVALALAATAAQVVWLALARLFVCYSASYSSADHCHRFTEPIQ